MFSRIVLGLSSIVTSRFCFRFYLCFGVVLVDRFSLSVGWCIRNKAERKCRKFCLEHDVEALYTKAVAMYRFNDKVMNSLSWLRGAMPKYLAVPPEVLVIVPMNPQVISYWC